MPVLVWFGNCDNPKRIAIEVQLDGATISKFVVPVCKLPRTAEDAQKLLKFTVTETHRSLFGEPKGQQLEGNIWEAGGDPDDLLLGVSFTADNRIWLNSIAIVYPNKRSRSELATGLVMITYPTPIGTEKQ